ncbi:heat shock 70 kDa protein 12A-like [Parambassis ranga]|uniref:Heat shock 70 kDa protein 12A-like n=1 Tax=Parambassis ranga TaxID=210632 RepID=A0A6P7K721_9TELE|nr:heat shock 70 kDa protein 12A-like [Parambassis ranga]
MGDLYIVAIDFGTTYSGYAFSMTSKEEEVSPYLKYWGEEVGLETPKAPTCILFNEHEEFLSFGYEARESYFQMRGEEARKTFFFDSFKMALYNRELNSNVTIKAANGKSMKALKVFTEALRYMKEDALKTISDSTHGRQFIASDFTWVLTVPAIWDASAKQFMREAATKAGIVSSREQNQLVIALEPEAASIWCKSLPADGFIAENKGKEKLDQAPGTQYIVVDCGGGTIDITVHEVMEGGDLKELHKASGNDLGGKSVDRKFQEFLKEIFCNGVWDEYEEKHPNDVQKLMYQVTLLKKKDKSVGISCPMSLGDLAKKKQEIGKYFETVQGASWDEGSIRISKEKMKSFFAESLNGITKSIKEILNKDLNIEFILLVGGYAESQVLRKHIIKEFGGQCKVLCPFRPQEAIVKGAVMFGRNPAVVASRKSAFTYGIRISTRFNKSKHREDKKFTNKEGDWCGGIFKKLVEIDEDVGWGENRIHVLHPIERDQTGMNFSFCRTEKNNPVYVDEEGIKEIGMFVVDMPDTAGGMNRRVKLEIKFGFTEMTATATDEDSNATESIKLNFMSKS